MFNCVTTREYKVRGKTILFSSTDEEGEEKFRLSDYGATLTVEELRVAAEAIIAFCQERQERQLTESK